MPPHCHDILHNELQGFEVFRYTDIRFTFSGDSSRQITLRLVFCQQQSPEPALDLLFGSELAALTVSVVSFYNLEAEENKQCETLFDRPPGAPALKVSEVLYLYRTLIDIILQIAETEAIHILTFQAYNEKLRRIYDRFVRKFATIKNLKAFIQGACYAIRTSS